MLDISQMKYKPILLTETGKQIDLSNAVTSLSWQHNSREIAQRVDCSLRNGEFEGQEIASIAKPGCMIIVIAECGGRKEEAARGVITDWTSQYSNKSDTVNITCFDELYYLQKSQDNIYYTAGISTQSAIMDILTNWKIPVSEYRGPNVTHGKLVYKAESLSDVILKILDDAEKKGGEKCIIRCISGQVSILPRGSNTPVYHFDEDNISQCTVKYSTANMVTRVKILAREDKEQRSKVEAVLDGKTEFGIRQKISVRESDSTLAEAKSSAQEILNKEGDIEKTFTVNDVPDIPFIRKGDLVHLDAGALKGFYYVEGIRHDATNGKMSMDLELK